MIGADIMEEVEVEKEGEEVEGAKVAKEEETREVEEAVA